MAGRFSSLTTNLLIDLVILFSFLIAFEPALTGIPIHEWFSVVLIGMLIVHILLHWRWIVNVLACYLRQWLHSSRWHLLLDAALFIAMTTVMFSGILISRSILPVFNMPASRDFVWRVLHSRSADLTLILTALHFAVHWKWMLNTLTRYVLAPFKTLVWQAFGNRQAKVGE